MPGYFLMRRDLATPIAPASLPAGITLTPFTVQTARASRDLMKRIYPDGLGDNNISFEGFWAWLTSEARYDPELMFVATTGAAVVGFCHCWRESEIKDLVVDPDVRGRGLGTALLTLALQGFARRGASDVDLKTEVDNVKAQSLYRRLGFVIVGRVED